MRQPLLITNSITNQKNYLKSFVVTPDNQSLFIAEAFGIQEGWENRIVNLNLPEPLPDIVLITGESGCGKSTLLKEMGTPTILEIPDKPLHSWASSEEESLRLLNAVGLNDASLFVLKFDHLSDSQQARARMYLCLCNKLKVLIVDEFLSTLDRKTAKALAFSFQKMLRKEGIKLIAATAQDDLRDYLQPDLLIAGRAFPSRWSTVSRESPVANPFIIQITRESKDAYREHTLGEIHYKGKYTGGKQEYLAARIDGEIVGWLIGKILPGTRQHRIARVVVHPTYRGCGVGQNLIRLYVQMHPGCDTVAAMARFNPVFEKAGMVRVKDVKIEPPKGLRDSIKLTDIEWASKPTCFALMADPKLREAVAPHATTQFVNPAGYLNKSNNPEGITPEERKARLLQYVKDEQDLAASALWGLRPRTMAKFVGPQHKDFPRG